MPFTVLHSLDVLPAAGHVLLIGADALNPAESASSRLAAYASAGRAVIVLDQKNPLRYQALPGAMPPATNQGYIAFAENLDDPVLQGLEQKDFFTWGQDGLVYRNAYLKPTSGGKSLVECGDELNYTALAEMDAGKGVLLLSQLVIEKDLPTDAAAQRLMVNLLAYAASYRRVFKPVEVAAGDNPPLLKALNAAGLQYSGVSGPLPAIARPGTIAVINATPANLHALASNPQKVNTFTHSGGWIILNNLRPEGLADYNKLVGFDHMIRPFKQEKVTWPAVRSPLTAGLATSNIVMGSGKQILSFASGQYPDPEAYSFVVDYDEVAPFGKSPFYAYDNITNNYTMADGFWPLIINLGVPDDGKPVEVPITLPKPQTITQFTWVSDNNYEGTTKVNLVFNGTDKVSFDTVPNGEPQTFDVVPPRTAKTITLQVAGWQNVPDKLSNGKVLIGIDNIYLKAARPADFHDKVRPLLNIGAMMEYPRGAGGIVLCNVNFKDTELVAENAGKKQAIIAAILRNLHAPFSGGKSIIAGAGNLSYSPVDLSKQANQYTGDRGWFGDRNFTFADLPAGRQLFAGVPYSVYSFATSIVPTVLMLGGGGVPGHLPDQVTGIPVNRKADALFFLQAARIDQRRSPDDIKKGKQYEMADYVIHYADGTQIKVPIYSEIDVENYQQKT
ncbi:MAG: hypothetical protein LC772_04660, partial [Chloroflexi bacterium]|nr:hypothetical protein [Chloroflexota bacterium]